MKIITIETKYYLLKPHAVQTETSDYYYIKVENELIPERAVWMQGYVNHMGGVSTVGAPLSEELSKELEAELKEALGPNYRSRENCCWYDCAQGRHKCLNPDEKMQKCNGVCIDFKTN